MSFEKMMWGETPHATRRKIKPILIGVGLLLLIVAMASNKPAADTQHSSACGRDPAQCLSAEQFVKNNKALARSLSETCLKAFERTAKYEIKWAHWSDNFTHYLTDQPEQLAQGYFIAVDPDVKVQNGFGAFANGQARCRINIKSKDISYANFYPN